MMNSNHSPQTRDYFLEPGFILMTEKPTCISTVLGSCVSVCLYDRRRQYGGMNHFRFPFTGDSTRSTALYGNVATLLLVRMMLEHGSREKHLEAQLFGGAHNPDVSPTDIGRENVRMAQKALRKYRIRIVSEDVGGMMGRKVVFNTGTAELAVIRVNKLRKADWYPYENER